MKLTDEEQRALDEFLEQAGADMLPKMQSSSFCLTVMTGAVDIKLAVEVGCALLLEKPLIILAIRDAWVPKRLMELADSVVRVEDLMSPESREKVLAVMLSVAEKLRPPA